MNALNRLLSKVTDDGYWHYTGAFNLLSMLKSGFIKLSATHGTESDNRTKEPYYFSMTRVRRSNHDQVVIHLKGLKARYKIVPISYWGPTYVDPKTKLPLMDEYEDRLVSNKDTIPIKYIASVEVIYSNNFKPWLRKLFIALKQRKIPFLVYKSTKDFNNKKPTPLKEFDLTGAPVEDVRRARSGSSQDIGFMTAVLKGHWDKNYRSSKLWMQRIRREPSWDKSLKTQLDSLFHNEKKNPKTALFWAEAKKQGITDIQGVVDFLVQKYGDNE